ncbi:MAG: hypothetical protein D6706_02825 [Chloroflexi bacterium]|nr:MAG: hypothetical protein D6706_02825 [Chloroflexota bacterium]
MEHERYQYMMMDALDGELTAEEHVTLEAHLRACPACMREWESLLAVDTLFRQTPAIAPPTGFAERTMELLSLGRERLWMMAFLYVSLLLGGALPLMAGLWLATRLGPILQQPSVWRSVLESLAKTARVVVTVLGALLSGVGELIAQQPAFLGWLFVMMGLVLLWAGVYRQLTRQSVYIS